MVSLAHPTWYPSVRSVGNVIMFARAHRQQPERTGHEEAVDRDNYLVIRQLTHQYPGGAGIAGLTLSIRKGELIALLGPSGCGKTTTLRCIAGIEKPQLGEILLDGKTFDSSERRIHLPPERRDIGFVFQSYALWPHMSVLENVAYPLRSRRVSHDVAKSRAEQMLDLVGLGSRGRDSPGQLSGGQQQRVALARALAYAPKLLLLDEPLSNLDAHLRESLRQDIRRIQRELCITAVYVTHDRIEAMALSDRLVLMSSGRIEQVGSPRDLLAAPASPSTAAMLGAANTIHGVVSRAEPDGTEAVVSVSLSAGGHHVELAARGPASLTAGNPVTVCIRPGQIRLSLRPPSTGDHSAQYGVVREWYPTGTDFQYILDLGGGLTMKALSLTDLGIAVGDQVWFSYDARTATCFNTQSQDPKG